MKIVAAQLDPIVGDVAGNTKRLLDTVFQHLDEGDLFCFPELFLCGYPPKDLLERRWFVEQVEQAVRDIVEYSRKCAGKGILFGAPVSTARSAGKGLYNAAVLVSEGRILSIVPKALLPTYDVFDELRYFDSAEDVQVVEFGGECLGISVCEDAWTDPTAWPGRLPYAQDPIAALAVQGATVMINISASPFNVGKENIRYNLISRHAARHGVPFIYVNQVGGNDELIFDGRSLAVDSKGAPVAVFPSFTESVQVIDTEAVGEKGSYRAEEEIATVCKALELGLRDYASKTGFTQAVIGLSGGIDSSVTCAVAARALGPENILGISLPSRYSSQGSLDDARGLAENLGIDYRVVNIDDIYAAYLTELAPHFAGTQPDTAEENIQARIRGNIWMAFSNKFGYLPLSAGNKSELAVGYCTLYGDMSGGLGVIADVPKMMVYELARYINREGEIIPENCLKKAPSAELRPDQTDQDTLPPYPILDAILELYVEDALCIEEIAERGYDMETVKWVARRVDRNEFKRQQAAPGLRVTSKAFGFGRRMPIAARFRA